jgi:hypothetical protein
MIADMTRGRTNLARAAASVTLLSIAMFASACTKPIERDDARMATTPEQERSAPTQPAVRPQEAAVETPKTPTTTSKQPVEQPAAAMEPAPAAPVHTVAELMGKRQAEVTALMGAPTRIEQRAASTVWVYEGGDCGLDVFFFLDMATSDERVLTVAPTAQPVAAAAAAESPTAGPPAADPAGTSAAADPAGTSAGTAVDAVDVCYGKLRRS